MTSRECTWCLASGVSLTEDHVFPVCVGGARPLVVDACGSCQTKLSQAEGELIRRSPLGLFRTIHGPAPRTPQRPDSGTVDTVIATVRDSRGGWAEVACRASPTGSPFQWLPRIEVNAVRRKIRARAAARPDLTRLIRELASARAPDSISLQRMLRPFSELPDEITADEDFWPRIFRDVRGAIRIRARDVMEAHSVWAIAAHEARVGRILREWKEQIVPAGERHTLVMVWKDDAVLRVVAKIVFGALRLAAPNVPTIESYGRLRRFAVDGGPQEPVASIVQVTDPGGESAVADHQYVVIVRRETGPVCIVGLYGAHFVVPLDELPAELPTPWVATVRTDGTCGTIVGNANEAMSIAAAVERLACPAGA